MSNQYAHQHTMAKTSVKFQNDWPKTIGGVALTMHPLLIVDERTSNNLPKFDPNLSVISQDIERKHFYSSIKAYTSAEN